MSALPQKADITERRRHVRFVPKAAVSKCNKNPLSKADLFDHLVGDLLEMHRHAEAQCFGSVEIDDKLVLRW
jgi:hypothetical protein